MKSGALCESIFNKVCEVIVERKLISQIHPSLYFIAVWCKRMNRYFQWLTAKNKFANEINIDKLPYRVLTHKSVLIKHLGDSNVQLQYNKVTNLKIAYKKIDGILIKPGEIFSFCKLVGLPTKSKGYLEGMELSFGDDKTGIGGGLCQLANLIYWLSLHTSLTTIERHHHSFDPFPDNNRVIPFGSGATVFYNYVDLQIRNDTDCTFQINIWFSDKYLEGEIRVDKELDYSYCVFEKKHRFIKKDNMFYRENEIWRNKILDNGNVVSTELITSNNALVKYIPQQYEEV